MDLPISRTDYEAEGLDVATVAADPIEQFTKWMDDAVAAGAPEAGAMVLSTVDVAGRPRGRNVLLRGVDDQGFMFYTNFGSDKAKALDATGVASLTFHWFEVHRQVIVEGTVVRATNDESDAYFASRPRESQLGAWASAQSSILASRDELLTALSEATERFAETEVTRPPFWGGYRVTPMVVEFWQGQPSRLHDRIRYERSAVDTSWETVRLSP